MRNAKKTPIVHYRLDLFCEKCGDGELKTTNEISKTLIKTKYLHVCNKCGDTQLLDDQYPKIINEDNGPSELIYLI